ncbi:MAG: hypothetical protein JSS56_04845 [Proteobacteria bacterium]|nr:hypothetical protein [Pseudomonadota bacterium]
MIDILFDYFLNPPTRLKTWGRVMSGIGMALIVAGVYLGAGLGAINVVLKVGNAKGGPTTLAET